MKKNKLNQAENVDDEKFKSMLTPLVCCQQASAQQPNTEKVEG